MDPLNFRQTTHALAFSRMLDLAQTRVPLLAGFLKAWKVGIGFLKVWKILNHFL